MKKRILVIGLVLVLILGALAGCGGNKSSDMAVSEEPMANYGMSKQSAPQVMLTADMADGGNYLVAESKAEYEQNVEVGEVNFDEKIIYTSDITIETENFMDSINAIEEKVAEVKGYIQNSSIHGRGFDEGDPRYGYYLIRVPKESFDYVKKTAENWGSVINKSTNSSDVSEQYFDTESRIETLEIQQERLLALLEKADKMEDILTIERELQNVRYQLESYTSSIRRLDSQIEYSTISVNVYEVKDVTVVPIGFGEELVDQIKSSAKAFGEFLKATLFAGIYYIPYLAIFAVVIVVLARRIRKVEIKGKIKNPIKTRKSQKEEIEE